MSGKSDSKSNGIDNLAGNQNDKQSSNLNTDMETDLEIEERLSNIFKRLDRDGNGAINIQELTSALKGAGMSTRYAEVSVIIIQLILLLFLLLLFLSSFMMRNHKNEIINNCNVIVHTEIPERFRCK